MLALSALSRAVSGHQQHDPRHRRVGTGKELVARALQRQLAPARIAPSCLNHAAPFPETLLESELFGHMRGSFTGALPNKRAHRGRGSGTVFLDEIGRDEAR